MHKHSYQVRFVNANNVKKHESEADVFVNKHRRVLSTAEAGEEDNSILVV